MSRKLIIGIFLAVLAGPLMAAPFAYINNNTADDPDDPGTIVSGNLVSVLDLATEEIVTNIEVGGEPRAIAVDPDRSRVYVGARLNLTVSVIDADTNTVIEELLVDLEAFSIVINPVNGEIYVAVADALVANSGGVQIFNADLSNAKEPETITTNNQPISLAVTPDGTKLYLGAFAGQSVLVMDVATRNIEREIPLGAFPAGMLASVDGSRIYVSDFIGAAINVINTANDSLVDSVAVGRGADDLAQNADGTRLYVGNVVDNTVSVVNTEILEEIETINVGEQPRGVDIAPDGRLVVTNATDDTVSIVSDIAKTTVTTVNMPLNSTPFSYGAFIIGEDSGPALELDASWSGAWFDPTQNGHGFLLQFLPGGFVLVYWFSFDSTGAPTWFFGVGSIDGDTITVPLLFEPDGPSFPPFFDPADFVAVDWGVLILRFFDCNLGEAEWESLFGEFGDGRMDLERITSTDTLGCEDETEKGLPLVESGNPLGPTGFAGGPLMDINPITGAGEALFDMGAFGPVAGFESGDGGALFAGGSGPGNGAGTGSPFTQIGGGVPLTITAAFSGAWFDATQNGHGFLFQVLPGGIVVVYWFTFDSEGNPVWLFGVGEIDGDRVEFDLLWEPDGPAFPPDFDPADFDAIPWGTLVIVFFDCNTGMAEWVSLLGEFGSGEMNLERITITDTLECEI